MIEIVFRYIEIVVLDGPKLKSQPGLLGHPIGGQPAGIQPSIAAFSAFSLASAAR